MLILFFSLQLSYSGEVLVWDYSRETDMLVASSGKGDESHNEPISKVLWQKTAGKRRHYNVRASFTSRFLYYIQRVFDWFKE